MKNKYCAYFFIFFFFWIGQRDSSSRNHPYDLLQVFFRCYFIFIMELTALSVQFFSKEILSLHAKQVLFFSLGPCSKLIRIHSLFFFLSVAISFIFSFIPWGVFFWREREEEEEEQEEKRRRRKKRKSKKKERVKQGRRRKRKARWGEEGETLFFSRKKGLNWEKKTWWKKIS